MSSCRNNYKDGRKYFQFDIYYQKNKFSKSTNCREKKHVFCLVTCGQKKGPIQTFRNASTDNPCLCSKVKIRIKKLKKRTARRRPLRPIVQFLF